MCIINKIKDICYKLPIEYPNFITEIPYYESCTDFNN